MFLTFFCFIEISWLNIIFSAFFMLSASFITIALWLCFTWCQIIIIAQNIYYYCYDCNYMYQLSL